MAVDVAAPRRRRLTPLQRWGAVLLATLAVLVADRLTKSWALRRLDAGQIVDVIGSLRFNLAFNTGMAFSKGSGAGPIIGLIAVVIAVVLLVVARRVNSMLQLILIGVVIGGALGNVIDRLIRVGEIGSTGSGFMSGAVVDFIDLQWWPVFNIADAAIVVGGIGLALTGLRAPEDEDVPLADADSSEQVPNDDTIPTDAVARDDDPADADVTTGDLTPTHADSADGSRTDG